MNVLILRAQAAQRVPGCRYLHHRRPGGVAGRGPFHVAMVNIGPGNHEQAIDWLEKAFETRSSHMLYIKQGAQFDPLRDDPRFVSLIERMGW